MGGGGGFGDGVVVYRWWLTKSAPDTTARSSRESRERGSAGSLAPTPEVARTCHASPATLRCLRINIGLCLPLPSTAHTGQCLLCAAVRVVPSCPLIVCRCAWRATVLRSVFVGQSYELVVIDGIHSKNRSLKSEFSCRFGANSSFKVRSA